MEKEDIIIKEITNDLKWKERIIIYLFKNIIVKVYGIAQKKIFNNMNV